MQSGLFLELLGEIVVTLGDEEIVYVDFDLVALGFIKVSAPLFHPEFGLLSYATGPLAVL